MLKRICPVCTKEFKPYFKKQKFCSSECNKRYFKRVKDTFGTYKNFKNWLDSGLIDWKDFNEFII